MGKIVNMRYRTYKELYPKEKQVPNSYNSKNKTVDVYLSEEQAKDYHLNVEEIEVRIPYKLYKNELDGYYRKRDSYDPKDKTIIVYMTTAEAMERGLV